MSEPYVFEKREPSAKMFNHSQKFHLRVEVSHVQVYLASRDIPNNREEIGHSPQTPQRTSRA